MGSPWNTEPCAKGLLGQAQEAAERLKARGIVPRLAVLRVGENPASRVYVEKKARMCRELGFASDQLEYPETVPQQVLLDEIARLNSDPAVHGILVQLPLPGAVEERAILHHIHPDKDVDGFHPLNVARLALGEDGLFPCTPMGVMALLREQFRNLAGRHAVVVGRSNIVGKPMAQLLLAAHCSVTILHSRSIGAAELAKQGDILIAAVGRPGLVDGSWIKPGACVVDVGINELKDPAELARLTREDSPKRKRLAISGRVLYGDVHFDQAMAVAERVTPVPGGVGPLTIAQLMVNCVKAAERLNP